MKDSFIKIGVTLGLVIIAVLIVISCAAYGWYERDGLHIGLLKSKATVLGTSITAENSGDAANGGKACLALLIIGLFFDVINIALLALNISGFMKTRIKIGMNFFNYWVYFIPHLTINSAFFIIGLIVWTAVTSIENHFSYCWYFTLFSSIGCFIAAAILWVKGN